jgi:hypothetical protein
MFTARRPFALSLAGAAPWIPPQMYFYMVQNELRREWGHPTRTNPSADYATSFALLLACITSFSELFQIRHSEMLR